MGTDPGLDAQANMQDIDTLLGRLEAALDHFAPGLTAQLPGPATDAAVRSLEAQYGAPLPAAARSLLAWHDGSGRWKIVPGFSGYLLSAEGMASDYALCCRLYEDRHANRQRDRFLPDPEWVASSPFYDWIHHPRRWPIGATVTGETLVIDEFPGGIGTMGQLLLADNEGGIGLVALSLEELLSSLLDRVEAGTAVWGEVSNEYACWRDSQSLEELHAWSLLPYFRQYVRVLG
jgi:cell wall assembly regulator SMI1